MSTPNDRLIATVPGIELFLLPDGSWSLRSNAGTTRAAEACEAFDAFDSLISGFAQPTEVEFRIPLRELFDLLEGCESILESAVNGWRCENDVWVSADASEDPHEGPSCVGTFWRHGCGTYLHRWADIFAVYQSGLEGENSSWVALDVRTLEEASDKAQQILDNLCYDAELIWPAFMGLDNLVESDRYPKPESAVPVERRVAWWSYCEEEVCNLLVCRYVELDDDEGAPFEYVHWLVVNAHSTR